MASELWDPKVSCSLSLLTSCSVIKDLHLFSLSTGGEVPVLWTFGVRVSGLKRKKDYGERKTDVNPLHIRGKN